MRSQFTLNVVVVAVGVLNHMASTASAQWTAVELHPAGGSGGQGWGAQGGKQVGKNYVAGNQRAILWSGSAASYVNLQPAGSSASEAYGMGGGQQVGRITISGNSRASLWTGTAASWVNMHPIGAIGSEAYGTDGTQQVGWVHDDTSTYRATLWTGSVGSLVDLHPAGAIYSEARGVHGGQQAGFASYGGGYHACLWTGSAGSMVDLTPVGASSALAYDVHGGVQVGQTNFSFDFIGRASVWYGSAATWVSLHPFPGDDGTSIAYATNGGNQVGAVSSSAGGPHASFWSGTAASWVNLHAYLPAHFSHSVARGISSDGGSIQVVGYAYNVTTLRDQPIMWTLGPIAPPCPADVNDDGAVNITDLLFVISNWGAGAGNPADVNGDGVVNIADLLAVIAGWGMCA